MKPRYYGVYKVSSNTVQTNKKLFVAFLGINQFRRVGLRYVCWFYVGNTQRLTKSRFMEKPEIEPATPGLQDIGLFPIPRHLQGLVKHRSNIIVLVKHLKGLLHGIGN